MKTMYSGDSNKIILKQETQEIVQSYDEDLGHEENIPLLPSGIQSNIRNKRVLECCCYIKRKRY